MFDIYSESSDGSSRFILGKSGNHKIYVIGLNPSTAIQQKSDSTVSRVMKIASKNGFDGFIILNLYPVRSTNYNDLPLTPNNNLYSKNIDKITEILSEVNSPKIWVAWGEPIASRIYFNQALFEIYKRVKFLNIKWIHYGALTKSGHPRHPSRSSYGWEMNDFNLDKYIEKNFEK